jgi:hypothetical protein
MSDDGSRVVIGAIFNGYPNYESGHVRIYDIDSSETSWTQVGQDIDGEATCDQSGVSVAMSADGSRIAIGALNNDGNGFISGHVRIYDIDSSEMSWTQVGQDIDGEAANDRSGRSIAMSADGSRIAIGAPDNDGNSSIDSGHVRIYDIDSSGTSWTQVSQDIDGEAAGDRSGSSVAMSADGSRIAIGANFNDGNASDSGHVRIYDIDSSGTSRTQVGQDIDGEAADDRSGWSVAMSANGSRIAIGSRVNDDNGCRSGHVRIYDIDSSGISWIQVGQDIDGEAALDFSGSSVAMSADGSRIAIGAFVNNGNGSTDSGHVRIYDIDSSGTSWTQVGQDIDGEAAFDEAGQAVAISADGSRIVIGAPDNDGNGSDSGHVRIYRLVDALWFPIGLEPAITPKPASPRFRVNLPSI